MARVQGGSQLSPAKGVEGSARQSCDNSRGSWRKARTLANENRPRKPWRSKENGLFLVFCRQSRFRGTLTSHVRGRGFESPPSPPKKSPDSVRHSGVFFRGSAKRSAAFRTVVRQFGFRAAKIRVAVWTMRCALWLNRWSYRSDITLVKEAPCPGARSRAGDADYRFSARS
jgi:hypothetical protein